MTSIGRGLDALTRAAGIDPDSDESRLATALAEADDQLLEDLVTLRRAKGLTQQTVADRMKRDKSAVSNFERLSADPHLSTIRRYAAAIGAVITHSVQDAHATSFGRPTVSVIGLTQGVFRANETLVPPSVNALLRNKLAGTSQGSGKTRLNVELVAQ